MMTVSIILENTNSVSYNNSVHNENVSVVNNYGKRGVVDSVLGFVDKQKDRKEAKERRIREEHERARIRAEQQSAKTKTFFLKHWYIFAVLAIALIGSLAFAINKDEKEREKAKQAHLAAGEIQIGKSSSDFSKQNYRDVIQTLKTAGFTNIQMDVIEDIIVGWVTKDGEVERVSINGETTFYGSNWYKTDVPIVVTFHAKSKEEVLKNIDLDTNGYTSNESNAYEQQNQGTAVGTYIGENGCVLVFGYNY